jgi:hypothetical protein
LQSKKCELQSKHHTFSSSNKMASTLRFNVELDLHFQIMDRFFMDGNLTFDGASGARHLTHADIKTRIINLASITRLYPDVVRIQARGRTNDFVHFYEWNRIRLLVGEGVGVINLSPEEEKELCLYLAFNLESPLSCWVKGVSKIVFYPDLVRLIFTFLFALFTKNGCPNNQRSIRKDYRN